MVRRSSVRSEPNAEHTSSNGKRKTAPVEEFSQRLLAHGVPEHAIQQAAEEMIAAQ